MAASPDAVTLLGRSGSTYVLRFSTNAVCRIQDELGKSLLDVLREQIRAATTDVAAMRTIVHLALVVPPDGSLETAGDIIDDVGMVDTQRAIAEALGMSQGQKVNSEWRQIRVNAASLGILSDRFWGMTLDDIAVAREGATLLWREVYNALIFHAWHVEAFSRTKGKLPSLESLMKKPEAPASQSEPMSAEVKAAEEDMNWRVRRAAMRRRAALKKNKTQRAVLGRKRK